MPKVAKKKTRVAAPRIETKAAVDRWPIVAPLILLAMTVLCYWTPMTSNGTSILWDAADYYQVVQHYFSQEIHAGVNPLFGRHTRGRGIRFLPIPRWARCIR